MQSEEQRLIDGLFSRLKEAEAHSASRDASAEERIAQHVSAQPAAPYYMAQTILIQEAAIKQLNDRIQALESQVSQLQAAKPSSGGFLSGLFGGGGSSRGSDPIPGAEQYGRPQTSAQPQYAPQQQSYAPQAAARGGGFMAGALQTAAGVAGGVVLGNMLTNMFSGSHPQEIVNIIEEKPQPDAAAQDAAAGDDPFRQGDDQFLADNTWNDDFDAGFGDDDIGSDDDSWV
ncbi:MULTISPECIES: DUF2076 domain-containing protein [Klebsiella]|uniref:DUF2076 domain-containing protein n=1 Tax=Klebsiella quasipneumoniae subsp. quasipneumoniae TaxID=1667327 RepID=A0AAN1Y8K1_9ENTR|nr:MULTISPECIES: DUF2076 domain-containing protein [Klebsiella]MCJ1872522.1 DUF2076 family protein [Klebsiella sp. HSTU-Sny5]MCU7506658.1 DUF2076 domain-containing protein [Klebsiella quasipneumoniae]MDX7606094.1 DUF2076 domain-containing protein [Klebsiella quasipneumoniae]OVX10382.1 ABC transporter substrate-binding protein [Klebsiella quasipneumoniae subsp. similipneumoniae]BDO04435.1 hypothetical protein KAM622c_40220 [Klebsiella quasipneumoniae subsp. quasipneumoniae]